MAQVTVMKTKSSEKPAMKLEKMEKNAAKAAAFLKQLANEHRLLVLCALAGQELSVTELNLRVPLSQSALSQHLAGLREAGLVVTRKEAQTVFYRLKSESVMRVIDVLHELYCK